MRNTKKARIIYCYIGIAIVAILIYGGCRKAEPEIIKTQEEYQMELLDSLNTMLLLARQGDISKMPGIYKDGYWEYLEDMDLPVTYKGPYSEIRPRKEIAPGIEIFHEKLTLYIHCSRLVGEESTLPTVEDITVEDIAKVYAAYDEELDKKFYKLYWWWANFSDFCDRYFNTMREVYKLYFQQYGFFNGKEHYGEMLTEDIIALEQFVRDNPDFMPKETHYSKLYDMRVINIDEFRTLYKAVKEDQESVK